MRMLKAIGRVLAAMAALVTVIIWEAGKWVVKCLPGYRPPDPQDLLCEYQNVAHAVATAAKQDHPLERARNIQLIADAMFRRQPVRDEWLVGLGDKTVSWLTTLNADMLIATARAKPEALQAHLAGKQPIRGLLAFDQESIDAYRAAVQADQAAPVPEHTRRPKRRQEPLMPAFGNMC